MIWIAFFCFLAQQEEKMRIEEEERRVKAVELKEKRKLQEKLDEKRKAELMKEHNAIEKADNFYKLVVNLAKKITFYYSI